MRRAGWQVVGLPEYTFARSGGRTVPVCVDITIRLPIGNASRATVEAAIAARKTAIIAMFDAGVPQHRIAERWGISQSQVCRIMSGKTSGRRPDARRIPTLRKRR